ncbi:MAG: hypothetical protein WAK48_04475 [Candidatus Acidiferrum sp.]|jgi:hypothetical protein
MIRTGEIGKGMGQIQFSLMGLDTAQLQPKLNALCMVGPLLWAIIRLWLFE